MKCLDVFRMKLVVVGFVGAVLICGGIAKADFTFGEPTNIGPVVNSSASDGSACISSDGLELYFNSERPGGYGSGDLWVTTRQSVQAEWSAPVNLGPLINTSNGEGLACISYDGLTLYFNTGPGVLLRKTTRATRSDPWQEPVSLGPQVDSWDPDNPFLSSDGLSLYFDTNQLGGYGGWDIFVTTRATPSDLWEEPINLGSSINSSNHDGQHSISADDKLFFFSSYNRSGGMGRNDMWMSTRTDISSPWSPAVNLGPKVNSSTHDADPVISSDGNTLYFWSDRSGGIGSSDIWQVSLHPIVDFNGDKIVDAEDVCIMVDFWGTNEPLCDIGPMPWGDGIVDVEDLKVLAEHLFEVLPGRRFPNP